MQAKVNFIYQLISCVKKHYIKSLAILSKNGKKANCNIIIIAVN